METAAIILVVIVILAGLSMEMKLARANRIARASHDLLKAILEELRSRKSEVGSPAAAGKLQSEGQWKAPPVPEAEKNRDAEVPPTLKKTEPKVYRID